VCKVCECANYQNAKQRQAVSNGFCKKGKGAGVARAAHVDAGGWRWHDGRLHGWFATDGETYCRAVRQPAGERCAIMAGRVIAPVLKVRGAKKQFRLRSRAEDLLTAGHDVTAAAAAMVAEGLCEKHIAKDVVEWVKTYNWTRFSKK